MSLELRTAYIEPTENEEELKSRVLDALCEMSNCDWDFNGNNGEYYLWEEAKGFESNQDYVVEKVKDILSIDGMVADFFSRWVGCDSFYENYEYAILRNDDEQIIGIALAYTTDN